MQVERPERNIIRILHSESSKTLEKQSERILDLLDSFGANTKGVEFDQDATNFFMIIKARILKSNYEAFLKEEIQK